MRRAPAWALLLLSMGWQVAVGQGAGQQVVAALERYRLAVLATDIEQQVSSFTEDGELAQGSEPVLQGRMTIRALLQAQRNVKVVGFELRTAATRVEGQLAIQNGFYSQRTISPQHEATMENGVFEVRWSRQPDGSWLISRLRTDPVGASPADGDARKP